LPPVPGELGLRGEPVDAPLDEGSFPRLLRRAMTADAPFAKPAEPEGCSCRGETSPDRGAAMTEERRRMKLSKE
jgi:hypothetical protein